MIKNDKIVADFLDASTLWSDDDMAFVKKDIRNGRDVWAIYSADGEKIAEAENEEYAIIIAKQNDYFPVSLN